MATDSNEYNNNVDYIDHLIDLSNELAKASMKDEKVKPNFPHPPSGMIDSDAMYLEEKEHQKGWYAKRPLQAGTILLISKPLGMVMNWEEDDDDEKGEDEEVNEEEEPQGGLKRNGLLILNLLHKIHANPNIWFDKLSTLYPRDLQTAATLPKWTCEDENVNAEIATSVEKLKTIPAFSKNNDAIKEIAIRLPLIVRYNCLSVETSPELLIHPNPTQGGHVNLSGTALYHEPSFFNHSKNPNVVRFALGDVMFFVVGCSSDEMVKEGEELCISYIEHEMLMEDAKRRNALLDMDFTETDDNNEYDTKKQEKAIQIGENKNDDNEEEEEEEDGPPNYPMIDTEIQQELINTFPFSERISSIQELASQAIKEDWYKCDTQNLNIILAMTYDAMGHFDEALELWCKCVEFAERYLPYLDENGIVLYVQAALCARALSLQQKRGEKSCDNDGLAKKYAKLALQKHSLLYGGGVARFRTRYEKEINLQLRKEIDDGSNKKRKKDGTLIDPPKLRGQTAMDALWPLE